MVRWTIRQLGQLPNVQIAGKSLVEKSHHEKNFHLIYHHKTFAKKAYIPLAGKTPATDWRNQEESL